MSVELETITKYHVQPLYQSLLAFTRPGSRTNLEEFANTELYFEKSRSTDLVKLYTGHGAFFSAWRNSKGNLVLNLVNSDYSELRHPLFYAGVFVDEVMGYFYDMNRPILGIDCIWEPESVNYKKYWQLVNSGYDVVTATVNTWTGAIASKYNFAPSQLPRSEFIDGKWVLTAKFSA